MVPEIKRILLATDLSENARYAYRYATALAGPLNARIVILYVMENLSASARWLVGDIVGETRWKSLETARETAVIDAVRLRIQACCRQSPGDSAISKSIEDEIVIKQGHSAEQIVQFAEDTDCDLVVMGSRGHGLLAEAMVGSTSRRVIRHCSKPVLVIRLPEYGSIEADRSAPDTGH